MTSVATETFGPLTWYGIDYGADTGMKPQVREFSDTQSAFVTAREHFIGDDGVPPLAALTPPGYISTYTGRFTPLAPRAIDVDIRDIAHSLAMQCRYAGHCIRFYSVAEHSVHIARWLLENAPHAALHGLLHDAPEAYLVDVPRPVKKSLYGYKQAEAAVWDVIAEAFSLSRMIPPEVHEADNRIIADEMMQNMHECDPGYTYPLEITLECWDPARAEREFLDMYRRLL